jgi:hypothetical protein
MNKKVATGAVLTAMVTALVTITNLPPGLVVTSQVFQVQNERTSFIVQSEGDDRLLLVGVGYPEGVGKFVESLSANGQALSRATKGALGGIGDLELWSLAAPPIGPVTVLLTLTDDFDAEIVADVLKNVDQSNPIHHASVAVGKGVKDSRIFCSGGSATVVFVMTVPPTIDFATPGGYDLITSAVGGKARMSVLLDDDRSEDSFNLVFTSLAHFGAIVVSLNVAP